MYVASSSEPLPSLFKLCPYSYKEKLRFYVLLILSTKLKEIFPCKVLMKLLIYQNSLLDFGGGGGLCFPIPL